MSNCKNLTIGLIDSGIGGISVLRQLIEKFNGGNYIYFADNFNMPYGNKSKGWLKKRLKIIINELKTVYKVDVIIIACNTASIALKDSKEENIKTMSFIKDQVYLTTRLTQRYLQSNLVISGGTLASKIEKYIFNKTKLNEIVKQFVKKNHLDKFNSYVLGCTHYELVSDIFQKYCEKSKVVKNSAYLIKDLSFNNTTKELNIKIILSKKSEELENKIYKLIRG